MYASLEADDDTHLSDTMKASANRFTSLCKNDSALTGPILAFNTQQLTASNDTRYDSSTVPQVQENGPTFDTDDSDDTTLSNL